MQSSGSRLLCRLLLALATVFLFSACSAAPRAELWVIGDLGGHLDGCPCIEEPTAGLVSIAAHLRGRDRSRSLLIDSGNSTKPGMDPDLSDLLSAAQADIGYDYLGPDGPGAPKQPGQSLVGSPGVPFYKTLPNGTVLLLVPGHREEDFHSAMAQAQAPADFTIGIFNGPRASLETFAPRLPRIEVWIYAGEGHRVAAGPGDTPAYYSAGQRGNSVLILTLERRPDQGLLRSSRFIDAAWGKSTSDPWLQERLKVYYQPQDIPEKGHESRERPGITYYSVASCPSCRSLTPWIESLAKTSNTQLNVVHIDGAAGYETLLKAANSHGTTPRGVPALSYNGWFLQGSDEISSQLATALSGTVPPSPQAPPGHDNAPVLSATHPDLSFVPVFLAGLIDGINPCAFTTLLFLISSLLVAGLSRRQLMLSGFIYVLSVGLSYGAAGLGLFSLLRTTSTLPILSLAIRILLALGMAVLTALSLVDALRAAFGKADQMLLQMPQGIKDHLRKTIRMQRKGAIALGSSLVLGIVVAVFELTCTGQVYLPFIAWLSNRSLADALPPLGIYLAGFLLPLLAVFVLASLGMNSKTFGQFYSRHVALTKILLAAVFAVLLALTVVQIVQSL